MRGGKRKGAGRPPKKDKRVRVQITLTPTILERLESTGKKSEIIETALLEYFKNIDRKRSK